MQVETYPDQEAFCRTPAYQQWLSQWPQPAHAAVDLWVDHDQHMLDMWPRRLHLTRCATRLPFHFLDSLEIGDRACVDIGCGHNWFPQFYPTLWGVDPNHEHHRDEELTAEWWGANWGQWHRAYSNSAMHFCQQAEIPQQMARVRGLLRPGGRAMVSLNRHITHEFTADYQEDRLRDQLAQTPGLTRMVWIDSPANACMDGNVWLWLRA